MSALQQYRHWFIPALGFFVVLLVALVEAGSDNDFRIYLAASNDIFAGKDIYTESYKNGFHYLYSPLFAVLIYPFHFLPLYGAQFAWVLINAVLFFFSSRVLLKWSGVMDLPARQRNIVIALWLIFLLRFLRDNFHYGQVTILLLFLVVQGMEWVRQGRVFAGAALIALGINFKIFPVVLLPYLFYRGQFRALLMIIAWWAFLLFLPALVLGFSQNKLLLQDWFVHIDPTNRVHLVDTEETTFCSLTTLVPALLMKTVPDPYALHLPRNIADLPPGQVILILNIIRAALIIFTFYFLRPAPFRPPDNRTQDLWAISYLMLVVPLIFPHQQAYSYYLLSPAALYCLVYLAGAGREKGYYLRVMLLTLAALCFNVYIIAGEFNPYFEHYKIVTYGGLISGVLLAICRPRKFTFTPPASG